MSHNRNSPLALHVTEEDHLLGGPVAVVTILEYGDFECPNCRQAAPAAKLLLRRFGGRARMAYRHYPLEAVHAHALHAALAAKAAGAQGRFWPMHDLLFKNQGRFEPGQLRGYAEQLQLDMPQFDSDMAGPRLLQRFRSHADGAREHGVRGTPGFFVNGELQDVSFGIQSLFDGARRALALADLLPPVTPPYNQ